ncbi:hypothetical protein PsAD46_01373 [Pseudovibrio sp. Ad46]|uniref:hypothetical protein n=1 Tax=unclassified Pseudovibrio TaxID=2627060 RepID=UPI0007AE62F0|nr:MULTISPECIES: hypothetical protein [unclassified Pseudovibrio]KZK91846.1 hypothetical protein PsAD46_01373 [Pseudovibrio sp. Ad46]KZL01967.1 hypothetical protein PsAD5_00219 [Pseudovibrio sp. Ad5]
MPPISNAEKQARFRKKEDLKKHVNRRISEAQLAIFSLGDNEKTKLSQLKNLENLPSGWTDEDLVHAYEHIERIFFDLVEPDNALSVDVFDGRNEMGKFPKGSNARKRRIELEEATNDTRALASHLISALELAKLGSSEKAAALAEAMRHVARTLVDDKPLHFSDANLLCLATLPPHYRRPDWFNASFAKWISYRLGRDEAKNDLGEKIISYNWEM